MFHSLLPCSCAALLLSVLIQQGYDAYIAVFYAVSAVVLVSLALTVWVAVILKKDETGSVWLRR